MNFGGPPYGNGFPPQGMGMFPGAFPMAPNMQTAVPGMVPGPSVPTSYPQGQGPLAGREAKLGENGLYQAPEPEGPEIHEAKQFLKLNPGEEIKYGEYWAQACDGSDMVGGKEAVAFLGRAAKVSKGQLRRIWDISDHRKEGSLGRDEFYIALRLVALAQRGAELSTGGLRNFSGIQLIPDIAPPVKEAPAEPASDIQSNTFSWTVSEEVASRYDQFFKSLDTQRVGMIDGGQAVTFFGKSGLPRPTLKKIWDLSDVTRDGKLSMDEFRTAMHMVANIRNKRLTVTALPSALDPNGPNWLRIEGMHQQQPSPQLNPTSPTQMGLPPPQPPPMSQSFAMPPPMHQSPRSATPSVPSPQQAPVPNNESEDIREALRRERQEVERARREMEEMKAEMERLRLEKASIASEQTAMTHGHERTHQPFEQSPPLRPNPSTTSPRQPQLSKPPRSPITMAPKSDFIAMPPPARPQMAVPMPPPPAQPATLRPPQTPPQMNNRSPARVRTTPIDLGNDDDDIWDQPSPKASALSGPPLGAAGKRSSMAQSKDSVSSDDDDFWGGSGGFGAKPSLGPAGSQKPGAESASGNQGGFGGSELDDWVF